MNKFDKHLGDWAKDTGTLTMAENGGYDRLVCWYMGKERPLPGSLQECCKIAGARTPREREAVAYLLDRFFKPRDGKWHHDRCDAEIAAQRKRVADASAAATASWATPGRRSRKPKKANEINGTPMQPHMQSHSDSDAYLPPSTNSSSAPNGAGTGVPPDPADVLFATGVAMLMASDVPERNARSFLARQSKLHGEQAVVDALYRCAQVKPVQPIPWLVEALGKPPTSGPRKAADRKSRQLETAGAMFGSLFQQTPGADPDKPMEVIDVDAKPIAAA